MALAAPALATLVQAKMLLYPTGAADNPALAAMAQAIAEAVVEHITSAATLVVATTCPAGAGTGTGTVT